MSNPTSSIGSGLNIKELVTNLVEAESKDKKIRFDKEESTAKAKITAVGLLKSSLSQFDDALFKWQQSDPFQRMDVSATTYLGNNVVSGTATANATAGNYTVEVTQLAKNLKCGTQTTFENMATVVGTGTLTLTMGTASTSFNIDSTCNTVQGIMDTVNAASAASGISLNAIATSTGAVLVFSATQTGTNYNFTVSVTDDGDGNNTDNAGLSQLASNNLNTLQLAQNATVNIDGVAVISDSNTLNTAIQGVTLDLLVTNAGFPVTVSITNDLPGAYESILTFVDKCNAVLKTISEFTVYGGDDGGKSGVLIGDATLRSIEFQMRRVFNTMNSALPSGFSSLSQIGITTDQYTGQLTINDDMLMAALENNFQAVGSLFLDKNLGIVTTMGNFIENYTDVTGLLQSKLNVFKSKIDSITDQRITLERRLTQLQSRLLTQFIAMEKAVARFNSLKEFLKTQMESMPKPNSIRSR